MTSTANPDMMTAGEHRRQRDEKEYHEYLAEGQAEADAVAAEHDLQQQRDAFAIRVSSDPLLAEGGDRVARELLKTVVAGAINDYITSNAARDSAIITTTHAARTLGLVDDIGDDVVVRTSGTSKGLQIRGTRVELSGGWQRKAEHALRDALSETRRSLRTS